MKKILSAIGNAPPGAIFGGILIATLAAAFGVRKFRQSKSAAPATTH